MAFNLFDQYKQSVCYIYSVCKQSVHLVDRIAFIDVTGPERTDIHIAGACAFGYPPRPIPRQRPSEHIDAQEQSQQKPCQQMWISTVVSTGPTMDSPQPKSHRAALLNSGRCRPYIACYRLLKGWCVYCRLKPCKKVPAAEGGYRYASAALYSTQVGDSMEVSSRVRYVLRLRSQPNVSMGMEVRCN